MAANNGYTPTQRRILDLLSDGVAHTKEELVKCLWDELAGPTILNQHISNIRDKLRPQGQDIINIQEQRVSYYRHVRIVSIKSE